MFEKSRTNSSDKDFIYLTKLLDKELWKQYGNEQAKYDKHNFLLNDEKAIVIYDNDTPIGCGAFRELSDKNSVEIKRMFVRKKYRGKGLGKLLLNEIESWAKELGFQSAILETGFKQTEAVLLYEKLGYTKIPNYPPYENMRESICMKKIFQQSGNFS